jgi:hypothetical protein
METTTASSTSSEFIIYSGKQGSTATVLRGHDTVVIGKQGTCNHYSLDVNILGKAAVLHFALAPLLWLGAMPTQPADDVT